MKTKKRLVRKYSNLIDRKVFGDSLTNNLGEVNLELTVANIQKYHKYIQRLKSYHQIRQEDYRNGAETYGYSSVESIEGNLLYISDRCHAAFRLAWLAGVPDGLKALTEVAH